MHSFPPSPPELSELDENVVQALYKDYGGNQDYAAFKERMLQGFASLYTERAKSRQWHLFSHDDLQKIILAFEYHQRAFIHSIQPKV